MVHPVSHACNFVVDVVDVFPDASVLSEVSGRGELPILLSILVAGSHLSSSHVRVNICNLKLIKPLLVLVIQSRVVRCIFHGKRGLVSNPILGIPTSLTTALDESWPSPLSLSPYLLAPEIWLLLLSSASDAGLLLF